MNLKNSGIDNQLRVLLESLLVRRETPNILIELDIVLIGIGVYLHRFVVDFEMPARHRIKQVLFPLISGNNLDISRCMA